MLENQVFTDSLPGGGEALRQVVRRSGSVPKGARNEASSRCLTANLNAVECASRWSEDGLKVGASGWVEKKIFENNAWRNERLL